MAKIRKKAIMAGHQIRHKSPKSQKKTRVFVGLLIVVTGLIGSALPLHAEMISKKYYKIRALDKTTARTQDIVGEVGKASQFGNLFINVQTCQKASPFDRPESAGFLQIWQRVVDNHSYSRQQLTKTPEQGNNTQQKKWFSKKQDDQETQWVFSGWMLASSPSLSAMDHPVYDVWVLDCMTNADGDVEEIPPAPEEEAAPETIAPASPAIEGTQEGTVPSTVPNTTNTVSEEDVGDEVIIENPTPDSTQTPVENTQETPLESQTQTTPQETTPQDPQSSDFNSLLNELNQNGTDPIQ
jgi:hypothetical protein